MVEIELLNTNVLANILKGYVRTPELKGFERDGLILIIADAMMRGGKEAIDKYNELEAAKKKPVYQGILHSVDKRVKKNPHPPGEKALLTLVKDFWVESDIAKRNIILSEYEQIVDMLIESGAWKVKPPRECELPSNFMPQKYFDYWNSTPWMAQNQTHTGDLTQEEEAVLKKYSPPQENKADTWTMYPITTTEKRLADLEKEVKDLKSRLKWYIREV